VFEDGRRGLAKQGVVAAAGALVGGLVVVDGVAGAQAATRQAHDLGSGAAGGAGPLAVGAGRRRLALVLAPLVAPAAAVATGVAARWRRCWRQCERHSWRPVRCCPLLWRWPALARWRAR
jgi:hypothetical protein